MLTAMLKALALTQLVECGLAALIFRRPTPVGYVALCNLLTNPAVNLLAAVARGLWSTVGYGIAVAILEAAVVIIEGLVLAALLRWPKSRALLLALLLNGASFGLGLLLGA